MSQPAKTAQPDRTAILAEAASKMEALRQSNPINGDGSNYMLTRALDVIAGLAGDDRGAVLAAVTAVRDERAAADRALYERLRAEQEANRRGRRDAKTDALEVGCSSCGASSNEPCWSDEAAGECEPHPERRRFAGRILPRGQQADA